MRFGYIILYELSSFHAYRLSFKDSKPNSWYNFSFVEPFIALIIAKAVLYCRDSIFSDNDELFGWSYTILPWSKWSLKNYLYFIKREELGKVRFSFRVCVCLRPSTLKASSVWGWKSRVQINDVVLKTLFSSAKFLQRYFSMNHQAFLTSCFILFAH